MSATHVESMAAAPFQLEREAHGRLVLITAEGTRHEGVMPVRAFPIAAAQEGLSIVDGDGREIVWVPSLGGLPADLRGLIEAELASREFTPVIERIVEVSTFSTPSVWQVETDRGATSFVLKAEEDIRRLSHTTLLVADSNGIHYLIREIDRDQ